MLERLFYAGFLIVFFGWVCLVAIGVFGEMQRDRALLPWIRDLLMTIGAMAVLGFAYIALRELWQTWH